MTPLLLGMNSCNDSGYKSQLPTNGLITSLTTNIFFCVCFMLLLAGACCDKLDPICLLGNKQNDKHNAGNIVQIFKIVFYHLVLQIC